MFTGILTHHGRISIHALLAESDLGPGVRGAQQRISIHALLAESDSRQSVLDAIASHFYPRSPCGERPLPRVS